MPRRGAAPSPRAGFALDWVLFRGYLPIMSGAAMAAFLRSPGGLGRDPQVVPARAGGAAQEARSGSVHKRRPPLRVPESRDEERRSGAEDRRARRDYRGPGERAVGGGTVPYVLPGLERSLTVRSVGEAQVSSWGSSTSSSRVGSRVRFRSTSTATSGWLGNLIVTA